MISVDTTAVALWHKGVIYLLYRLKSHCLYLISELAGHKLVIQSNLSFSVEWDPVKRLTRAGQWTNTEDHHCKGKVFLLLTFTHTVNCFVLDKELETRWIR